LAEVRKRVGSGEKSVFIVAPFSSYRADFNMSIFPRNKQELQDLVKTKDQLIKSLSYYTSHSAFNYGNWYKSTSVEQMRYASGFEPYYIGPKTYPLFDEVFIGCGADKVSHPTALNAAGYAFYVLPTGFIVHIDSTGMGSAWCKQWAGTKRAALKWESFSIKMDHDNRGGGFKEPWWDLAPVISRGSAADEATISISGNHKACPPCERCDCPKCEDLGTRKCPPCKECADGSTCPECPDHAPISVHDCRQFIEGYETEISFVKEGLQVAESLIEKMKQGQEDYKQIISQLQDENSKLKEYSNVITNLALGGTVVLGVVFGIRAFVWPKNKKIWVLPKSNHHHM